MNEIGAKPQPDVTKPKKGKQQHYRFLLIRRRRRRQTNFSKNDFLESFSILHFHETGVVGTVWTRSPIFPKVDEKLVATFLVCSWRPKTLGITWVVVVVLVTKKWDFQIAQKVPWYLGYQKISCRGGSPGLVVLGGDSASKGRGFESLTHKQDGHFSHLFVVKIVMFVWKDEKKWKEAGMAHLEKNPLHTVTFPHQSGFDIFRDKKMPTRHSPIRRTYL